MLHELAHLVTLEGHTDKFRRVLRELGGRATLNAKKRPGRKPRKPCKCGGHRFSEPGATWFYSDPYYLFHSWDECRPRQPGAPA